ncbi:hypothetical protein [Pseudonocardia sp. GCM10023141]|uniref:hypothetical protein n=1 Tax=Pseudonocardia sp. GCM10023141 TaxID=3252653 RepID=UPI003606320B
MRGRVPVCDVGNERRRQYGSAVAVWTGSLPPAVEVQAQRNRLDARRIARHAGWL